MSRDLARSWRKDYQPPAYTVEQVELIFDIQPEYVVVTSSLTVRRQGEERVDCVLNGEQLQLQWMELNGERLADGAFHYDEQADLLTLPQPPDHFTLRSCVHIDPYRNKALSGLYQSGDILCSQNEAQGFRRITFFPDRPDVMSRFTCEIRADRETYPVLLSNGNLVKQGPLDSSRHYARWCDPFPKPCYLFAVVAGRLDHVSDSFTTHSGRTVDLRIYTDPGKSSRALFAMDALKRSMAWDEQRFGREYDLDLFMIVAVDAFNFGAMENKGLNIFNSSLIYADPRSATDADFEAIEGVVAHEYFHNWTGNRITCRDWFQLTLKEGLTVYRDEEFSADQADRTVKRVKDVYHLRQVQYPEDAGPNRHPIRPESYIRIDNFYTPTVYSKGAAVIRMIADYVGAQGFRRGMDVYFDRFDGMAVCCDDFLQAIEDGSGEDLSSLRRWYSQAGTPRVKVTMDCRPKGDAVLTFQQSNPHAEEGAPPLGIPFPLTLYQPDGQIAAQLNGADSLLLTDRSTTLTFEGIEERPIPSLLLGHAAPVIVEYDYQEDELLLLLHCDQDPFNRYEAGQRLYTRYIHQPETPPPSSFWQTLSQLIDDEGLSPEYRALCLVPPSVQQLGASLSPPDYPLLWQRRQQFLRLMGQELVQSARQGFEAMRTHEAGYSPQLAGRRRLRACLAELLAQAGEGQLLFDYRPVNMSETLSALRLLCQHMPGEQTQAQLAQFRDRWQTEPLVLVKWFALQVAAVSEQTIDRAVSLTHDPLFQADNPNMIRSIYRTLARNLPVFHRPDGLGYRVLADEVIRVDAFNPMVASGLAGHFLAFSRLAPTQKQLMEPQLRRMLDSPGLSAACYEPLAAIVASGSD